MFFYRKCNYQLFDLVIISFITIDKDAEIYKAVYLVFDILSVNQTKYKLLSNKFIFHRKRKDLGNLFHKSYCFAKC